MPRSLLAVAAFGMLAAAYIAFAGDASGSPPEPGCTPSGGLAFVCGAEHPEDLAHIPNTPWLIASGFSDGAGLKLIDTRSGTLLRWYTGSIQQIRHNSSLFPGCDSAPDPALFNAHGISLKPAEDGRFALYVVNHGGREAIEVFTVDAAQPQPVLMWQGCVRLPAGLAANSVAVFRDGTILATILTRPGTTITDFVEGKKTGEVVEWRPGSTVFKPISGTELPGNNGVETSPDDKEFYVVAFGWHSVVAFSRAHPSRPLRRAAAPGFMPDNIHWDSGRLLVAGMQLDEPACGGTRKIVNGRADDMRCHRGYSVAELDPKSMTFKLVAYAGPNEVFNGVSAAVIVGDELWLGSYQADRVAHRPLMVPIPGDPVTTSAGLVAGTRLPSGVRAYLGIPYAAPPTQERRWKPPGDIRWSGVWVADRKGAECIQVLRPHNINHYFGEEASGEDCLYLNIWTPPDARPGSHLPVVVFIYGGGGTIGSSGMALYDGEHVAQHGAVFVNFNYRVGALGFMAHPELTHEQGGHSGNYGYLDQLAALRWIHTNIAAFGGDPARVLISGQSFGAGSVAAHIFSPLSKGLFRAAAMWSACNFTTSGPDLTTAEQAGLELQKRLGAANLEEMRALPADRILAQQAESQVGVSVNGVRTPPLIDGYFVTANKEELLRSRRFNDVPMLVSSNGDDLDAVMSPLTRATTVEEWQGLVRQMYRDDAATFLKFFPVNEDAGVHEAAHAAARENGMLGASRLCAQSQAKYGASRTYISLFTRKHPYVPGVRISDQNTDTIGAYHTADVPYWFNTFAAFNMFRETRNWTAEDRSLSQIMMRSMIEFARTGSPAVEEWSWPAWSPSDERFTVLDVKIRDERLDAARIEWLAAHPPAKIEEAKALTRPRD